MRIAVTSAASFVGYHLLRRLAQEGQEAVGLVWPAQDRYEEERRARLLAQGHRLLEVGDAATLARAVEDLRPSSVVHLSMVGAEELAGAGEAAQQAGAALSQWAALLGAASKAGVRHLVLGSGAGVYGAGEKLPLAVDTPLDRPLGLRAATQRAAELLGHAFSNAHHQAITALRFFSTYGPLDDPSRPPLRFALELLARQPVALHDAGQTRRDFVYVDDAVEVLVRSLDRIPEPASLDGAPFAIHNVGTGTPTPLARALELVEARIGRAAARVEAPLPKTSLHHTWADVRELQHSYGYRPGTPLSTGVAHTLDWLLSGEGEAWRPAEPPA